MLLPLFLDISSGELLVIFVAVFIVFGPKKLPEIARQIGKGMNEMRKVTSDLTREFKEGASQVKEQMNIPDPEFYGNTPYKAAEDVKPEAKQIPQAQPYSQSAYQEIHAKPEPNPEESGQKSGEEDEKSGEKGLLF